MKTMYMFCTLGFLVGAGCWGVAEGHCGNLEGDQTCAEQGRGAYCDTCRLESDGCTDVRPSAACHFPGAGIESATTGDTAATGPVDVTNTTEMVDTTYATTEAGASAEGTTVALSGESGTSTGVPECVSDAECEEPGKQFCGASGACVACDGTADPDAACSGLGGMTPLCFEGACVACEDRLLVFESTTGACVPCTEHDQCVSRACDIFVGTCFDPERVIEVGNGGESDTIAEGLAALNGLEIDRIDQRRGVLMLHNQANGVDFDESAVIDAVFDAVAVIAAPREINVPVWTYTGTASPTLTATGVMTRTYLDQVQLGNETNAVSKSLRCDGARVDIRRSRLIQYDGGGIEALGQCELVVQNSFIGDDDDNVDAVFIANETVTASIIYSTIGGGGGDSGSALRCPNQGPNVHIRNSLLVALSTSHEVICAGATLTSNATEGGLGNMNTYWFNDYNAGDFHLTTDAPEGIVIADWLPGDPTTDIDGTPRITADGQFGYAGADVP